MLLHCIPSGSYCFAERKKKIIGSHGNISTSLVVVLNCKHTFPHNWRYIWSTLIYSVARCLVCELIWKVCWPSASRRSPCMWSVISKEVVAFHGWPFLFKLTRINLGCRLEVFNFCLLFPSFLLCTTKRQSDLLSWDLNHISRVNICLSVYCIFVAVDRQIYIHAISISPSKGLSIFKL